MKVDGSLIFCDYNDISIIIDSISWRRVSLKNCSSLQALSPVLRKGLLYLIVFKKQCFQKSENVVVVATVSIVINAIEI